MFTRLVLHSKAKDSYAFKSHIEKSIVVFVQYYSVVLFIVAQSDSYICGKNSIKYDQSNKSY